MQVNDVLVAQDPYATHSDMAKIRDKIRHYYFGVDYAIVWEVITKRFPGIKPEIERMIADLEKHEADREQADRWRYFPSDVNSANLVRDLCEPPV